MPLRCDEEVTGPIGRPKQSTDAVHDIPHPKIIAFTIYLHDMPCKLGALGKALIDYFVELFASLECKVQGFENLCRGSLACRQRLFDLKQDHARLLSPETH